MIFDACFSLKSNQLKQCALQPVYSWVLITFVVLVTAIGNSFTSTTLQLIQDPTDIITLLATRLPTSTHFYMNYLCLQWVTHMLCLSRYMSLIKFLTYKNIYGEEEARRLSEPEDQGYYGIGGRSSRFSLFMVIFLTFHELSPAITIPSILNLAICRLVHSYLLIYAETPKVDL